MQVLGVFFKNVAIYTIFSQKKYKKSNDLDYIDCFISACIFFLICTDKKDTSYCVFRYFCVPLQQIIY